MSSNRNIYLYWVGKEYKLISILRNLIYLHSTNGIGYKVNLITDKNIRDYIKDIPNYFSSLCPAHQADFVRVCVICDYGGIWLDSDTLVIDKLDSLFEIIEKKNGFFIKENNTILCNGIFGSKKQTNLMIEWKKNLTNILNQKKNTIAWSEVGCQMLQSMYNKNPSLYNDYKIFEGLDNMYPFNWNKCVTEFIEKPYDNYKNIVREYQPLVVLVNSVYKKLENKTEKEILEGNMPINYFINKSTDLMKISVNKLHNKLMIYNYGQKDYISKSIINFGAWEPNITNIFNNIIENNVSVSSNHTIIDIGCNIGYFSLICAKHKNVAKIYSVDGNSTNINMLSLSCKRNGLTNINLINNCISDKVSYFKPSNKEFAESHGNIGGLSFEESNDMTGIISTSIDSLISENKINRVLIMKIDIEGGELNALKGALNTLNTNVVENIIIEITPKFNNDSIQILEILKDANYNLYNIPHQETGLLNHNKYYLQQIMSSPIQNITTFVTTIKIQTNVLAVQQ